LTLVKVRLKE